MMDPSTWWIYPHPHLLQVDQWVMKLTYTTAQSTQTQPNGEGAAMSNASGDVVTFDTAGVYKGNPLHPYQLDVQY
ncbi:hypothetical protein L207DRAFT_307128 [Hyaloscypha variabilis F]|uniref:Uncharacterized protein n=1 Tax=Hyaloscypha variabilis (strain UAMH 11265 / GT02V1 / F) TaxID=1149755 RepID=A0A2J6RUL7_HYAVF|nr:hypothetical protein L207DRAFT_307128 [Hyaloscypha variabilis F]